MGLFSQSGGSDAGNAYLLGDPSGGDRGDYTRAVMQGLTKKGMDATEQQNYGQGAQAVQGNPILSQLFGPGGQMDATGKQITDLSNRGYSLQPEDNEAYGQASGNIARMFGGQEQDLAQNLANRGISNSGVAGAQFTGLFGNKAEQLAGLQTNIAQKRMQMNQQRLAEMHNFMSSLGQQAGNAINSANDNIARTNQQQYNMGRGYTSDVQGQNNTAMSQRQQSQGPSTAQMISGGLGMASQVAGLASGVGGLGGGGGAPGYGNLQPGVGSGGISPAGTSTMFAGPDSYGTNDHRVVS